MLSSWVAIFKVPECIFRLSCHSLKTHDTVEEDKLIRFHRWVRLAVNTSVSVDIWIPVTVSQRENAAGLWWYWARTRDMPAMIRYLDHWATAAPEQIQIEIPSL
ncbi:hypothetical protein TNCV_389491 [Trichonephila clavipes]|nr:hypothetical protein TNCV_389491 [Trichonephila clavipes]